MSKKNFVIPTSMILSLAITPIVSNKINGVRMDKIDHYYTNTTKNDNEINAWSKIGNKQTLNAEDLESQGWNIRTIWSSNENLTDARVKNGYSEDDFDFSNGDAYYNFLICYKTFELKTTTRFKRYDESFDFYSYKDGTITTQASIPGGGGDFDIVNKETQDLTEAARLYNDFDFDSESSYRNYGVDFLMNKKMAQTYVTTTIERNTLTFKIAFVLREAIRTGNYGQHGGNPNDGQTDTQNSFFYFKQKAVVNYTDYQKEEKEYFGGDNENVYNVSHNNFINDDVVIIKYGVEQFYIGEYAYDLIANNREGRECVELEIVLGKYYNEYGVVIFANASETPNVGDTFLLKDTSNKDWVNGYYAKRFKITSIEYGYNGSITLKIKGKEVNNNG